MPGTRLVFCPHQAIAMSKAVCPTANSWVFILDSLWPICATTSGAAAPLSIKNECLGLDKKVRLCLKRRPRQILYAAFFLSDITWMSFIAHALLQLRGVALDRSVQRYV